MSTRRLIECVPNISEGRDPKVIAAVTQVVETVEGVKLLDVDPGAATNRTVITFAGEPEAVIEAAVLLVKRAGELIDMRKHSGAHPRFGATDVCPLVPISGVTMEETAAYARELGRRLGEELGLCVYLYEEAASTPARRNLADVRAGEYEGLSARIGTEQWKPDFGPAKFDAQRGATAVGARDFLVAYNVNFNSTSVKRANEIAFAVREKGCVARDAEGNVVLDAQGEKVRVPGTLKQVKGIGWFIEEYGIAQLSMNLTNISITAVHTVFDEVQRQADARGLRATGSEIVGLVPLSCLIDAGRHYLAKQRRSTGVSDAELIKIAVKSMGLDDLAPFDPATRVIEYVLEADAPARLVDLSLRGFTLETASESIAPGGGSVAAAAGALGAALGTMVANLSIEKKGWEERYEELDAVAARGKACCDELVRLVDADTDAFNGFTAARRLPKSTPEEIATRDEAIQEAIRGAIRVPLRVMEVSVQALEVAVLMAESGLAASASDAGVGALCARAAVRGAGLNVRINCPDLADPGERAEFLAAADAFVQRAAELETLALAAVDTNLA
jgi:glutamate formiminotransferase / formiminotetrahydrofolate cyclodeaminase